ncbi:MAG: hypothetical protein H7A36_02765 [Chlamydiales bacterium]|nr:hypothetical protein [Chlamydiales bacterium]
MKKWPFIFLVFPLLLLALFFQSNRNTAPIVIASFPRSGGWEISRMLAQFFKAPLLADSTIEQILKRNVICSFRRFPDESLKELPKLIIHVRDPRQALVSYVLQLDRLQTHQRYYEYQSHEEPPKEYYHWDFESKVNWQIDHFYKSAIHWTEEWVAFADSLEQGRALITEYDALRSAPLSFLRTLVTEFGGKESHFKEKHLNQRFPNVHSSFTTKHMTQWRELLTQEQQEYVNALLPKHLAERFHWE